MKRIYVEYCKYCDQEFLFEIERTVEQGFNDCLKKGGACYKCGGVNNVFIDFKQSENFYVVPEETDYETDGQKVL